MSRFSGWYESEPDEGFGASKANNEEGVEDFAEKMIARPGKTVARGEASQGVIVSAEEGLIGITADGWAWLLDELGCEDEDLTALLLAHNRQNPSLRVSGQAVDAGAADLLAWLFSEAEKAKDNTPRVALVPSALAQAMNERDAIRLGPPPSRSHS